jgi:hypothetical protein
MKEENLYTPDCIRTFTGIYVNVFEPTPEMICIEDIAHALSHQCRFGGHLPKFYSVAQHSTMVCMEHQTLQALMHDAAEAYLLDIPSPIKKRLAGYHEIEEGLLKVIGEKFGFDHVLTEEVKAADKMLLEFEWDNIMLEKDRIWCWSPEIAKDRFLGMFKALTK